MKVFVLDIDKCNGCFNCQIACKDEHCSQPWLPYADAQPERDHFWLKVIQKERGQVPVVRVSYIPTLCNHCADAPCLVAGDDAVYRREDGLVLIDPVKAKGRTDIVASCPIGAIYYNEERDIPQKCTGCAHLLDNGWEVPRCVDACATKALRYVEESEVDLSQATTLDELQGLGAKVYYYNYPKRFLAGAVIDFEKDEVVIGADVALLDEDSVIAEVKTDYLGDFIFKQIEAKSYTVKVTAPGYEELILTGDVTEKDISLGDRGIKASL
jgi:Fe-S-cluster-containing dehydrogenase component